MGREFANSEELHREMDGLDWRRGKPKITYCCTYGSMTHVEKPTWSTLECKIQPCLLTLNSLC